MHYNILDDERRQILPLLGQLKGEFYLAGGTALALQIGHRDSIDFDFFTHDDIDTNKLFERLRIIFAAHTILKTQDEENTLSVIIDDAIKLSFMTYKYDLLEALVAEEHLNLASVKDIACMKLSAVTGRATSKDYIDLYFLLQMFTLSELLELAAKKYTSLDTNLIIKSLVYFDDVYEEPIIFMEGKEVAWDVVKEAMRQELKDL